MVAASEPSEHRPNEPTSASRHLSRLFEEQVGLTAGARVERVRVEAARTMLEGGDEGLPVVADRTGFGSTETMRRAFLRELGVTPGAYRSQFRTRRPRRARRAALGGQTLVGKKVRIELDVQAIAPARR